MPLQQQIIEMLSRVRFTQDKILKVTHETAGEVKALNRRVDRIEDREHGRRQNSGSQWEPRDYMLAGVSIVSVLAALSEKVGWTTVFAGLAKLYGGK